MIFDRVRSFGYGCSLPRIFVVLARQKSIKSSFGPFGPLDHCFCKNTGCSILYLKLTPSDLCYFSPVQSCCSNSFGSYRLTGRGDGIGHRTTADWSSTWSSALMRRSGFSFFCKYVDFSGSYRFDPLLEVNSFWTPYYFSRLLRMIEHIKQRELRESNTGSRKKSECKLCCTLGLLLKEDSPEVQMV